MVYTTYFWWWLGFIVVLHTLLNLCSKYVSIFWRPWTMRAAPWHDFASSQGMPCGHLWASYHDPNPARVTRSIHRLIMFLSKIAISGVSGHTPSQAHFFKKNSVVQMVCASMMQSGTVERYEVQETETCRIQIASCYCTRIIVSRCSETISEPQYLFA